jgi:DNA-binding MarR family transcriptional regulator/N-acetylglutamate synthase-like GNAT family acetyltransferase
MPKPAKLPPVPAERIAAVRRFNRFHTRLVGALGEHLLSSEYSLPQLRVLYEIACAPDGKPPSAAQLGRALGLDAGYLSRLLTGLEQAGLVKREPAPGNARRLTLHLSTTGRKVFGRLDAASAREVAAVLRKLSDPEQAELVAAMAGVERLLDRARVRPDFILRDPAPGDLGLVVQQQALLYTREYGWDWTFEALLAEIVARFAREFVPGKERCWIAERDGAVVGSVFVVRQDDETAKLRMLYVDASARGLGLGRRLVEECLRFAREAGYRRMVLWTNVGLDTARRIYETLGFELLEEEPHHSFGKDLVGQNWGLEL